MVRRTRSFVSFAFFATTLVGCNQPRPSDESGSGNEDDSADTGITPDPGCDSIEHPLSDADDPTPWGKTGADLLAEVPESVTTTLDWRLQQNGVEVEIPGRSGSSTGLELTFDVGAARFFWSEGVDLDPDDGVTCFNSLALEFSVSLSTTDGTMTAEDQMLLMVVPEGSQDGPQVQASGELQVPTPELQFVAPENLPPVRRQVRMTFQEGQLIEGFFTATAEGSETYAIRFASF